MPLDINTLRDEPARVKESQRRRYKDEGIIDQILEYDVEWRQTGKQLQGLTKEYKLIKREIHQIEVRNFIKHSLWKCLLIFPNFLQKNGTNINPYQHLFIPVTLCIIAVIVHQLEIFDTKMALIILIPSLITIILIQRIFNQYNELNVAKRTKLEMENEQITLKERNEYLKEQRDKLLNTIGNIVDDKVPISDNEDKDNKLIQLKEIIPLNDEEFTQIVNDKGGGKPDKDKLKQHDELLWMIGGYERKHGAKVAGNKGYYLMGPAVSLQMALQNYGVHFLQNRDNLNNIDIDQKDDDINAKDTTRNFIPIYPPFFMNKDIMGKTAQLEDYDETLYHVIGNNVDDDKQDTKEKYLIATSEQPLSALHCDEALTDKDLPIRYCGISTCFRKEAGAGKDFCGIFRVHQFEKIEQFVYCKPNESWDIFDELVGNAKEFYDTLGIGYKIVNIVSGHLNNAAARKYDLEGWFPGLKRHRELVSASNCTDYQARAMETRYGAMRKKTKDGRKGRKEYVHMLNATLVATTRTICAILENYQTNKGIVVPKVLRPYMNGIDFIPFINDPLTK